MKKRLLLCGLILLCLQGPCLNFMPDCDLSQIEISPASATAQNIGYYQELFNKLLTKVDDLEQSNMTLMNKLQAQEKELHKMSLLQQQFNNQAVQIRQLENKVKSLEQGVSSAADIKGLNDLKTYIGTLEKRVSEAERKNEVTQTSINKLMKIMEKMVQGGHVTASTSTGTAAAASSVPESGSTYYTVIEGDTLSKIAAAYKQERGLTTSVPNIIATIRKANPGKNLDRISIGQKIRIPDNL